MNEKHISNVVPVMYENDKIGTAIIETVKNKYIEKIERVTDLWTYTEIKINKELKYLIKHLYAFHRVEMFAVIDYDKFEGVALTLGYPNKEFAIDKRNKIFPFTPKYDEIEFIGESKPLKEKN